MTITRYTADQLQRSTNGDLVTYEDWLNEYAARRSVLKYLANLQNRYAQLKEDYHHEVTARQEAFKGRVELQRLYQEATEELEYLRKMCRSLQRDVEELEERLRCR